MQAMLASIEEVYPMSAVSGWLNYRGYFGDERRAKRADQVFAQLVDSKSAVINQTSATRAELVGVSLFFIAIWCITRTFILESTGDSRGY